MREGGRYVGKLEQERLCSECVIVENEFHFVMMCPLYVELRNSFISKIMNIFPFLSDYSLYEQFIFFMGFNDKSLHCLFARFVHDAMSVRSGVGVA